MNGPIRSICLMLAAGLALGLAQAAPGSAQNAMNDTAIDCSKADSTMMQQPSTSQAMKPTGDVDKDYAQMMKMHNHQMMAMSKTEAACGKDPKMKAFAQKNLGLYRAGSKELNAILGGGA